MAVADGVAVTIVAEQEPGARAHLDQVDRRGDLTTDRGEAVAQRERPLDDVGLHQARLDQRGERGREGGAEVDQGGTGPLGRQRRRADDRRVVAGEFVLGTGEEQGVDRPEERHRRVLAGATARGEPK